MSNNNLMFPIGGLMNSNNASAQHQQSGGFGAEDLIKAYMQQQGNNPMQDVSKEIMKSDNVANNNSWQSLLFGNKDNMGMLTGGAQALGSLGSLYTGIQGMNQAKSQFNFNKQVTNRNAANNAKQTNYSLESRYRQALAGEGIYGSDGDSRTSSHMNKWAVDGSAIG